MFCYKDKTFCKFDDCKTWKKCNRAFTKTEQKAAQKWWGKWGKTSGAPVCFFVDKPECFDEKE